MRPEVKSQLFRMRLPALFVVGLLAGLLVPTRRVALELKGDNWIQATFRTQNIVVDNTVQVGPIGVPATAKFYLEDDSTTDTTAAWFVTQGTAHVGTGGNNEQIPIVIRNTTNFDTTATAGHATGIDLAVSGGISAGGNSMESIGIAISGHCSTGNCSTYSIKSTDTAGVIQNDGPVVFGGPLGTSSVQLGQAVQRFTVMPTSPTTTVPQLDIGIQAPVDGFAVHTKRTDSTGSLSGILVELDTTLSAGARGGFVISRGAGGGGAGNNSGIAVSGGAGYPFTTSVAGDLALFAEQGDIEFGADAVGFTMGMKLTTANQLDMLTHKIVNMADPTSAQEAATKAYVDAHAGGGLTGSGTANTTVKWTGSTALGNAWPTDDGTTWGVTSKFTITEASGNFRSFGTGTIDGAFVASSTGSFGGALDMTSHLINNVTDPSSAQDAATKHYVDNHTSLTWIPFSSGADGTVTFDGSSVVLGLTPSANVYTLTRDIIPAAMTVNSGVTIHTAGFRVLVAGTLTLNGKIECSGKKTGTSSGGSGCEGGFYSATQNGGGGGFAGNGAGGGAVSLAPLGLYTTATGPAHGLPGTVVGQGGGGGNSNTTTGGSGGAFSSLNAVGVGTYSQFSAIFGRPDGTTVVYQFGGSGGGGGGGDAGAGGGGGGGGSGGHVLVACKTLAGSGTLEAKGGDGTNGTLQGTTGSGGGGGGGGGLVDYFYGTKTGTVTCVVTGGVHGNRLGGGASENGGDGLGGICNAFSGDGT